MQTGPIHFVLTAAVVLTLLVSVALACPSGLVCPEGKNCTQPSDCITPSPSEPGGGSATTPSTTTGTTGETSSGPATTQEQIGLTHDPKDPNLVGVDIKPLSERDIMDMTFGGGAVRAYLDFLNAMLKMGEREMRGARAERISERRREKARDKAEKEAGVKEADEAWQRARHNYVKLHKEMRDRQEIEGLIHAGLKRSTEELDRRGDGPDDIGGKYGLTRKDIYKNYFTDWLMALDKTWAAQSAAAEAHTAEQAAMNEYMEARENASQLQEQYIEQWSK